MPEWKWFSRISAKLPVSFGFSSLVGEVKPDLPACAKLLSQSNTATAKKKYFMMDDVQNKGAKVIKMAVLAPVNRFVDNSFCYKVEKVKCSCPKAKHNRDSKKE